jgi:pimeloyl-ACP methyl ester carboxylesterase
VPVILLHGSFSNRRFWYSPKGIGLGAFLARQGFDVWVPEMRGHGLSKRNHDYARNRVADYARYDLPAIGAFVREQSAQVPHWIGHSLGGTTWRQPWVASTLAHRQWPQWHSLAARSAAPTGR